MMRQTLEALALAGFLVICGVGVLPIVRLWNG